MALGVFLCIISPVCLFILLSLGDKIIAGNIATAVGLSVLLILVAATQFFAMQINQIMARRSPKYRPSNQMKSMNTMNNIMTIFIIYLSATMPAAMSLYWITTNVITIVRTVYIQFFHVEKAKKEVEATTTNFLNKKK